MDAVDEYFEKHPLLGLIFYIFVLIDLVGLAACWVYLIIFISFNQGG